MSRASKRSQLSGIFIQNQFSGAFSQVSCQKLFSVRIYCEEISVRLRCQELSIKVSCQDLSIRASWQEFSVVQSMISCHSVRQQLSVFHQNLVILTINQISQLVAEVVSNQNQAESILTALTSTLVKQNQPSPVNPEAIKLLKYTK